MFKVFSVSVLLLFFVIIFKQHKPEYSFLFRLLAILSVFVPLIVLFDSIKDSLNGIINGAAFNRDYLKLAFKICAVTLCSGTVADICRDCNETALASITETVGRAVILVISFPVIRALFDFSSNILN